jgi:hypothetical protein
MKDLFYSESEKILFWVSGYDILNSKSNVVEATNDLLSDAKKFADVTQSDISKVHTVEVTSSNSYKCMRVFYIKDVECPQEAFTITASRGWTMWKWLNK